MLPRNHGEHTMKRWIIWTLLFAAMPQARAEDAFSKLTQALFDNMALSYMCRNEIGTASYQAARTITRDVLSKYVGEKNAINHTDQMDKKLKADPRAVNPKVNAAWCYEQKNDAMHLISVAQSRVVD